MQEKISDLKTLFQSRKSEHLKPLYERLSLKLARINPCDYVEYCLVDTDTGEHLVNYDIHKSWHLHIDHCWKVGKHPVIFAPWGFGKTVQIVLGRGSRFLGENKNARIKIVCCNDEFAVKRVMALRRMIEKNQRFHAVYPHIVPDMKDQWTSHAFFIQRDEGIETSTIDPSVESKGVLSSGGGTRANLIIFDDIVDYTNSIEKPALRAKVKQAFNSTWMSRLVPGGKIIYIATLWHKDDVSHELFTKQNFCILKQAISRDFKSIEQTLYNEDEGHPLLVEGIGGKGINNHIHGNNVGTVG